MSLGPSRIEEKTILILVHSALCTRFVSSSTLAKLVSEQDEIYGVKTIDWENSSWKYLSLIGEERIINLQCTKVYVFSDSVLCLGKIHENPRANTAWEQRLAWFKSSPEYRNLDRIDGEPMEFEWNIFSGFNTLQLSQEVQELLLGLNETPENFTGKIIFMSMFNDISRTLVISRSWFREKVVFYQWG